MDQIGSLLVHYQYSMITNGAVTNENTNEADLSLPSLFGIKLFDRKLNTFLKFL